MHEAGSRANIKLHSVGTHIPDEEEEEEEERGRGYVASEKVKEKARERLGRVVNELFVAVSFPPLAPLTTLLSFAFPSILPRSIKKIVSNISWNEGKIALNSCYIMLRIDFDLSSSASLLSREICEL